MYIARIALVCGAIIGMVVGMYNVHASEDAGMRFQTVLLLKITNATGYRDYHDQAVRFINEVGCTIDREIDLIKPPNGSIDIGDPNRVISLVCDSPDALSKLGQIPEYQKLVPLRQASTDGAPIVIGGKNVFSGKTSMTPTTDRLYVLKITNFKPNSKFHEELATIDSQLEPLGFHREKMIYVDSARGMATPTTFGFMFYDDPSQQKLLYGNKTLMESIGSFNKTYTDGIVYLEGVVATP